MNQPDSSNDQHPVELYARYHSLELKYKGSLASIRRLLARIAALGGLLTVGGIFK